MIELIKTSLSLYFFIPVLAIVGLYFSIKLRFVQITHISRAWSFFIGDRELKEDGHATSFSALSAVLGGNLGTGNIAGIAVALTMGGPGALFWMWVMAILGSVLKFVGCTLGVLYRTRDEAGEYVGGPMYYLHRALGLKKTAKFFCIITILTAFTVGNFVQMNSLALPIMEAGIHPMLIGVLMSILVGGVILGGLHRFSAVVSRVVPLMALFYIVACGSLILMNFEKIIPSLALILKAAFQPLPMASGVIGYTVLEGIRTGFDRGLFATDCGVGIAPILHSSVDSKTNRVRTALTQGLISTLSPLIVMIVCMLTGLVLMVTDAWLITDLESTNVCIEAFKKGFGYDWAGHLITITLFFFAFTTILTWSFCADKAIEFLFSRKYIKVFQYIFILSIPLGAYFTVTFVWTLADLFMNLMLLINISALVLLFNRVLRLIKKPDWNMVMKKASKSDTARIV
ncbi:amino acid carrier protein [Candidatus Berkiella cookevillensis]|uniref:Amino acid carrier protein n=1 Tax=Candidatus Berkiella cookevillensis TaxID=437022 RepID=A0A0Q9Y9W1_9GAMM|nr:amino acid carrier protein [Candidatus Berkiella cookevillensis]MCS5707993.1 amino acid carrier protein [Candidatus Berkiella cookevillensis]